MFKKVAFIGAGAIAESMITGILARHILEPQQIWLTNRSNKQRLETLRDCFEVSVSEQTEHVIQNADLIILSVKPKDISEVLFSIKDKLQENQVILSVLAGVSTDYISEQLALANPVIRAMPNTSAAIGLSATAIAAGRHATPDHLQQVSHLLRAIGTTVSVQENALHAITGLSGSGPAYIYYLVEAMEEAASHINLDTRVAKDLILQTLIGAAEMLRSSSETPRLLRRKITSPGGTTQAGISVLEDYHFQEGLIAAIQAATKRSEELGSPFEVLSD
ncbi:pyrroline-5-carboxylate reductase [Pullulanibacillus camelliae]|uniref:Pyrroline-5-carboxylate reductase n=1 Tax=Pullulanibacillus camelliae TaxID=1707096 RepID=A0A8J3DVI9_9BACL|nr:pyrroline-5-carboxylate reductase [Pullulanibacillus camelliae]GGE44687.1 pyrroline-5-carboxylate reductase [Pullulanibacillus camelliae]